MNTTPDSYLEECRAALKAEQAQSLAQTDQWSHVDKAKVHADWDALYRRIAPLVDAGLPSSAQVQELVAEHYAILCRFYTPSKKAYIGISLLYGEDPAMRDFHNGYHPRMLPWMASAMRVFADARL